MISFTFTKPLCSEPLIPRLELVSVTLVLVSVVVFAVKDKAAFPYTGRRMKMLSIIVGSMF